MSIIGEEIAAAPFLPTAHSYFANVNSIRNTESSAIPLPLVTTAAEGKVAPGRFLENLVLTVPSCFAAKDGAFARSCNLAPSIGSCMPNDGLLSDNL